MGEQMSAAQPPVPAASMESNGNWIHRQSDGRREHNVQSRHQEPNNNNGRHIFNVFDYGAIGDGRADDTQAFKDAWKATCMSSSSSPTMHIPREKTFLLQPLIFRGPCQSENVHVEINRKIVAPSDPSKWKCDSGNCNQWITFIEVDGLFIEGFGTIDGQGSQWWDHSCGHSKHGCLRAPRGFVIAHSNNVHLSNLSFKDSPQMHISFERSTGIYASNLTITAPGNSPNTDGIHIKKMCENVFIDHSQIGTGDDCISISDGTSHINISRIICGPGHGISIGSLGKGGQEETVEYVHVSDVEFMGTSNGVRIKTWQGGKGYARNIVFERISSHGATRPIIIDQFYCDHEGCRNHSTENGEETSSYCQNAYGRVHGEVVPMVPCLDRR
ncbi:hypothetical protein HHK36_015283 [Tetracentron sinense]|uniref:Endo-polygalacturonase n=1 Tax=Tetracentron sinense TaxID=13715 RepID=A0A835DDH7_TETSI|nr:hypothetical protein HHK36_015283 [Tetracentron sinense]